MRRVVITGLGVVSSIGHNAGEVTDALREGRSGIEFAPEYAELGFRSHVHGPVRIDPAEHIDRKTLRFMGDAAAFAHIAMAEAIADSGLDAADVSNVRTGLVAGSGGASTANNLLTTDLLREKGIRRVGPYMVPRTMSSTVAACLGTAFGIKGVGYSLSSACSTSAHCIGHGAELIQMGKQDIIFAGGGPLGEPSVDVSPRFAGAPTFAFVASPSSSTHTRSPRSTRTTRIARAFTSSRSTFASTHTNSSAFSAARAALELTSTRSGLFSPIRITPSRPPPAERVSTTYRCFFVPSAPSASLNTRLASAGAGIAPRSRTRHGAGGATRNRARGRGASSRAAPNDARCARRRAAGAGAGARATRDARGTRSDATGGWQSTAGAREAGDEGIE